MTLEAMPGPRPGTIDVGAGKKGGSPRLAQHDWYKDAVIYQLHIKAFFDSNGDGIGDFKGLLEKLDYVEQLGVNAIWVLPFYPSPLRDDGYDIAAYRAINPAYGTMRDFRRFVAEAHRRGISVITELVINHTSDQHRWFQRARRAKRGSAARDFYVWSDTDERYAGTRIIFLDTETSNWTWDPVAGQFFWHRFYSHQPDLNFDNPRVLEEIIKVMRFWLATGVDGLRLDAIPYLVEREGTSSENLPETHVILKKIRAALDAEFPDRMLLAEANQWPEDTQPYFGDGDECHMAFHFPLMPRIYMALAQEDRHPVSDIMRQTPEIPEECQWAIFLRNHDELTLEMVTDRERDYLWQTYAGDTRARINLGIRRRLAPLMQNDRRKIELMNALLMSLPGTPILYYGDELGMGDNIFLGDRDGVRTPMQWSADRNGGFSRANPQALFLPSRDGSRVRLSDHQRGSPAGRSFLAAELGPPHDRGAQAACGFRARDFHAALPWQSAGAGLCPGTRWANHAVRRKPGPLRAGRRARLVEFSRAGADRIAEPVPLSAHRRASLPADARRLWILLVPARHGGAGARVAQSRPGSIARIHYPDAPYGPARAGARGPRATPAGA
jgi:trehalose synthase